MLTRRNMHGRLGPEDLVAYLPGILVLRDNSTGWTSVYAAQHNIK